MGHADKSGVRPLRCKDRGSCDYHIHVINLSLSPSVPTPLLTVFTHGLQAQTADRFNHAHTVEQGMHAFKETIFKKSVDSQKLKMC